MPETPKTRRTAKSWQVSVLQRFSAGWRRLRLCVRVLRRFWACSLAAEMEYRINFLLAVLNSGLNLAGSIFGLFLFFRYSDRLGGWTWEEALLVMGVFTVLEGFSASLLGPNLNRIVAHVREGTMDFILLKPIDSQFWVSTRTLSLWGLPNAGLGTAITVYAAVHLQVSLAAAAAGVLMMAVGAVLLYGIWFLLAATSIWFVKIHNVTFVLRSVLEAGRFPVSAYPAVYRLVFTFVIPIAFLTTVPAQTMLGRSVALQLVLAVALALAFGVAARCFWRFSLRFYTSASS